MVDTALHNARHRVCVKHRYPNQGVALAVLAKIQRLGLPRNRQQRAYWCEDGCGAWHLTSHPLREHVDLTDSQVEQDRAELKIYETPDVARAATFVAIAVQDVGGTVGVADLIEQWRRRYQRHADTAARRSPRARLLRALRALDSVGTVHLAETDGLVTVVDLDDVQMVSANLDIFEDRNGFARRPSRWPRPPQVPEHLRGLRASVIASGEVGWKRVGKGIGGQAVPQTHAPKGARPTARQRLGEVIRTTRRWLATIVGLQAIRRGRR